MTSLLSRNFLLLAFFGSPLLFGNKSGSQNAIVKEIQSVGQNQFMVLDFVEIRDCNCDSGIKIVNVNKKLRRFNFTNKSKIWLLKNAGEYAEATLQQFMDARAGNHFGWGFDAETPFEFRFDSAGKKILEMRQVYLP